MKLLLTTDLAHDRGDLVLERVALDHAGTGEYVRSQVGTERESQMVDDHVKEQLTLTGQNRESYCCAAEDSDHSIGSSLPGSGGLVGGDVRGAGGVAASG